VTYSNALPYICWVKERGQPRVLGFVDKFFASTGEVNHHTRKQFEKIVGEAVAKAALSRFYEEEDPLADKKPNHPGSA
jgi:hypothetical protein